MLRSAVPWHRSHTGQGQRTAHPRSLYVLKEPRASLAASCRQRTPRRMVELIGLEPTTSALQGRRSPS
jgi:hypothetical protein